MDAGGGFTAKLKIDSISAKNHVVVCTYAGDNNFNPALDGAIDFQVQKARPAYESVDAPAILYGEGPTVIKGKMKPHSGGQIPCGQVQIRLGADTAYAPIDPATGQFQATLATQHLPAGKAQFAYEYQGDENFSGLAPVQGSLQVNHATPYFEHLIPAINYGSAHTILSGSIKSRSCRIPTGWVDVTLAGVKQRAPIDQQSGNFKALFDTKSLPVSGGPLPCEYHYAGDHSFQSSDNSASIDVETVQVTGRITIAGQPVKDVRAVAKDSAQGRHVQGHTTGDDGLYLLTVPAGLALQVEFPLTHTSADGRKLYLTGAHSNIVQPFQSIAMDATYELHDDLISGTTVKQIDGNHKAEPLAGVRVSLEDALTHAEVASKVTDAQGIFGFREVGQFILKFEPQKRHGSELLSTDTPSWGIVAYAERPSAPLAPIVYHAVGARVLGQVTDGAKGIEGIKVECFSAVNNRVTTAESDHLGSYSFENVPAGDAALNFRTLDMARDGTKWELKDKKTASQKFTLTTGQMKTADPTVYCLEKHSITWKVKCHDKPAANRLVEVRTKDGTLVVQAKRTGEDGIARFELARADEYMVYVFPDDRVPGGVLSRSVTVNSDFEGESDIPDPGTGGFGPSSGDVKESVIDLQSYPVLTEEVPAGMGPGQGGSGGSWSSSTAPIGQVAQNAINEVLSWRSKSDDSKAFVSALTQAFDLKEVEGHTQWKWTPRSYTVQTDMGAVTGAQASIYNRAKVALDQSLPMLDGLYALLPTFPQEDLNSIRDVARSQYISLVNEFGVVGGPRPPRVDQLFILLLGDLDVTNPENLVSGTLHEVRDRFGLRRQFVTNIAHEQNLTNFLILTDYVISLSQSWKNDKIFFIRNGVGGPEPFFGTQLVLLSRGLDVVSQSVRDTYFAMDSVFLGASERQTTQLDFNGITLPKLVREDHPFTFPPGTSSLFVSELLDWVDRSASEELPQVLQTSGKDGIPALKSIVDNLRHFVRAAILPIQKSPTLPPGYRTPRVQRTLLELAEALDETYRLSFEIKAPDLPAFGMHKRKQITSS